MVFSHCTAALARFWETQVVPTRLEGNFEFLSHTARPMWKPVTNVAVTPRKYEIGAFLSCFHFSCVRVVFGRLVGFVWESLGGGEEGQGMVVVANRELRRE